MFQIVSPAETVIAVSLELKIAETSGTMNLCIPARILKMLRGRFDQQWNSRRQKAEGGEAQRIYDLIKPVSIPLTSEIRRSKLTMDDLLKVSVGDVIELNERISDPVMLCGGGIPKFIGRIVQRRGKRAFEVMDRYTG
jgi:flagellar motor switch protein FliM